MESRPRHVAVEHLVPIELLGNFPNGAVALDKTRIHTIRAASKIHKELEQAVESISRPLP